jgi:hypothetical protein
MALALDVLSPFGAESTVPFTTSSAALYPLRVPFLHLCFFDFVDFDFVDFDFID